MLRFCGIANARFSGFYIPEARIGLNAAIRSRSTGS
jgi:3-hydroxymyristoyl/3-hydroxydecanoyl-(acyl carrier protein) dehydratase